jgi:hypothetical protein
LYGFWPFILIGAKTAAFGSQIALQATNACSTSNTHALPRIGLPEKDAQNYHQSAESKDYREQESKSWKQIDDAASC